jgi:hypothetical protein
METNYPEADRLKDVCILSKAEVKTEVLVSMSSLPIPVDVWSVICPLFLLGSCHAG